MLQSLKLILNAGFMEAFIVGANLELGVAITVSLGWQILLVRSLDLRTAW